MTADENPYGPWRLDLTPLTLEADAYHYYIDLERCLTSAQVLDWLCQIAGKTWASDDVLAGLVRAINHSLHPQATLCSSGIEKKISALELRGIVAKAAVTYPALVSGVTADSPDAPVTRAELRAEIARLDEEKHKGIR